jgi:hypothetical protein
MTNVTQSNDAISKVYSPTDSTFSTIFSQLPLENAQYFSGEAFTYTNPFILSLCSDLTQSQIEQVKQTVKETWLAMRPDYNECNCFEIHIVSVEKYTDQNTQQINTQISYICKAAEERVIEMISDIQANGRIPSNTEIFTRLKKIGFTQCIARNRRSLSMVDLAVMSPSLAEADFYELQKSIQTSLLSVRPDFVTNKKKISVKIISNRDALDLNSKSAVTQIYLQVTVDDQLIDFCTNTEFDIQRLIDALNFQNENSTIRVLNSNQIYSRNYFFTLVSNNRVRKASYPIIEQNILDIFMERYSKEYKTRNVSVSVAWQEECLDENKNIVYGLSILISDDNQPINNLLVLDKSIFLKLKSVAINESEMYNLRLRYDNNEYLHPLSKALVLYSNLLVCHRDYAKLESLLRDIVKDMFKGSCFFLVQT